MEEELRQRIEKLEELIRTLTSGDIPKLLAPYVSSTPTANGYITIEVNGRRYKIATVA